MSTPNYQYCAEYCNGRLPNCLHYKGRFGGLCATYRLLNNKKVVKTSDCEEADLEKLISLAGSIL